MSNGSNAPQGLRPVRYLDGSPWNGAFQKYNIASAYATNIFMFDPVTTLIDGTIGIGVAGAACRGVFLGCEYTQTDGTYKFSPYWPASTAVLTGTTVLAKIADDPNLVFDMQETNGSDLAGTALALADRGLNINFDVGPGTTATGMSTSSINNGTEATTATLNLKILDLSPTVGNVVGDFANWLVAWNNHQFRGGTGSVGV